MSAAVLALALALAPPASEPAGASANSGVAVIGPGRAGELSVRDAGGQAVATVTVDPQQPARLSLPPGRYAVVDAAGTSVANVTVKAGAQTTVDLPPAWDPPPRPPRRAPAAVGPAVVEVAVAKEDGPAPGGKRWTRWGSPLLSTLLPGLGQGINRQPGKGAAIFAGEVALILGSVALLVARRKDEGATPGDGGASDAEEVAREGALLAMTGAAGLLYIGQILDAYRFAVGKSVTPRKDHDVVLSVDRSATVGFRPGQPAFSLYQDFSISVLGQVHPRVTVGISDLGLKLGGANRRVVVQGGLRAAYRFFDRDRVWLGVGLGWIFQGTTAKPADDPLDPDAPQEANDNRFGAIPYLQFETRIFVLDRWSLNLTPRMSVPLTARQWGRGRVTPRYATTFELGTGVGVHF